MVIGVHTDGPTVCKEIYSSPRSLTHVHVYSTRVHVCSTHGDWCVPFPALMSRHFSAVKWAQSLSPSAILPHVQAALLAALLSCR